MVMKCLIKIGTEKTMEGGKSKMRFITIFSAMLICMSINPTYKLSTSLEGVISVVTFVALTMDLIDFFRKN